MYACEGLAWLRGGLAVERSQEKKGAIMVEKERKWDGEGGKYDGGGGKNRRVEGAGSWIGGLVL